MVLQLTLLPLCIKIQHFRNITLGPFGFLCWVHYESESCVWLFAASWNSPWNSPGQNTGVGSCSLLHGTCPIKGWNPGLPHCRQILYQLSHQGRPRILEWVSYLFSRNLPDPGIELGSAPLQTDSLPAEPLGKPKLGSVASKWCWLTICSPSLQTCYGWPNDSSLHGPK